MRSALPIVATGLMLFIAPQVAAADGLIRARQSLPDDPLAGLPLGSSDQNDQRERGKPSNKAPRSCQLGANPANPRSVGDLRATLAFVERGPRAWLCPQQHADVRLRITVDGNGRISAVESASGDSAIAGAMAKKLVGQSIAPRPEGPTQGTVVLSFVSTKK